MNVRTCTLLIALAAGGLLSACASAPGRDAAAKVDDNASAQPQRAPRICFTRNIDGFSRGEGNGLMLHQQGRVYRIDLQGQCRELDTSPALAVESFGRCLAVGDTILPVRLSPGLPPPEPCRVMRIWEARPVQR